MMETDMVMGQLIELAASARAPPVFFRKFPVCQPLISH